MMLFHFHFHLLLLSLGFCANSMKPNAMLRRSPPAAIIPHPADPHLDPHPAAFIGGTAGGTAENELHNMQQEGLVSDKEAAAVLKILQAAKAQNIGDRVYDKINIDGKSYSIPKSLLPPEEPMSDERRSSSDWQSTVASKYCSSETDPQSKREQCALCEWMTLVMHGTGVWWAGSNPKVRPHLHVLSL